MKLSALIGVAVAAVLLGGVASSARAENVARLRVPFPFLVGGHMLPAGQYNVSTDEEDPNVLVVAGVGGVACVQTVVQSGAIVSGQRPALTFTRNEGDWRLSAVRDTGAYPRQLIVTSSQ